MNKSVPRINILYADGDFAVLEKPHNMKCAPLYEGEEDTALNAVLKEFPSARAVHGKKSIEAGLVHRLDTGTHGLFVVALTQTAFDSLWLQMKDGVFVKTYTAFVDASGAPNGINGINGGAKTESALLKNARVGRATHAFGKNARNPDCTDCTKSFSENTYYIEENVQTETPPLVFPPFEGAFSENADICSYFRFYGKERKAVLPVSPREKANKASFAAKKCGNVLYKTHIEKIHKNTAWKTVHGSSTAIECSLSRGFRHQVRSHLAWAGYPICGDAVYNPKSAHGFLELHATKLSFVHPRTGETCLFCLNDFFTSDTR